jgi:DNA recombination protein RmuC
MVVRMPGGRSAVIDAKVPLEAYLDAMNAEDEPLRVRRMADHARLVRDHVRKLGSKGYWEAMAESPAFTVMFVPDPFLSAALEQEPAIMEDAWRANVVIATPMTLFTVLHIVADDWRRAQFEENSRRIVEAGRDLHKRLATFLDHFGKAGAGLKAAVNRYNDAVGSLERMVLPKAREFGRLGVLPAQESELTTLASIADSPRALVAPEAPVQGAPPSEAA